MSSIHHTQPAALVSHLVMHPNKLAFYSHYFGLYDTIRQLDKPSPMLTGASYQHANLNVLETNGRAFDF